MSEHDHSHSHSHSHAHSHGHAHSHAHAQSGDGGAGEMSFADRMDKLLAHWLDHNADHAATYRQWADKARENGMAEVAGLLEEAAEMTLAISGKFEAAAARIEK